MMLLLALNVKPFGHLKFIKGRMNVGTLYKRYVPAGIFYDVTYEGTVIRKYLKHF